MHRWRNPGGDTLEIRGCLTWINAQAGLRGETLRAARDRGSGPQTYPPQGGWVVSNQAEAGHDLADLDDLSEQTEGTGVNGRAADAPLARREGHPCGPGGSGVLESQRPEGLDLIGTEPERNVQTAMGWAGL